MKNKFNQIFDDHHDGYDSEKFERTFSGPMTPVRMEKLKQIAAQNTWRENCGHDYDCCGCQFEQKVTITYTYNQVVVTIIKSYNY